MNEKQYNSVLLLAILVTTLAVIAQRFFPDKRLTVWPANYIYYFYSTGEAVGKPSAFWLDQDQGLWRCHYPPDEQGQNFLCSFNVLFFPDQKDRFCRLSTVDPLTMIYDAVFEPLHPLSATASFGVSEKLGGDDFASAFKRADNALYKAKAQGRNCCIVADIGLAD